MTYSSEFRRCMETLDVPGVRALWRKISPHLSQPATDEDALASLHMARTASEAMTLKARAYSHRWLEDRGLPSQLPDALKPRAERIYPRVVTGVGLAINLGARELAPAGEMIRKAMSDEIEDCYAARREDPDYVKPRMNDAGARERKRLFGAFERIYALGSV